MHLFAAAHGRPSLIGVRRGMPCGLVHCTVIASDVNASTRLIIIVCR